MLRSAKLALPMKLRSLFCLRCTNNFGQISSLDVTGSQNRQGDGLPACKQSSCGQLLQKSYGARRHLKRAAQLLPTASQAARGFSERAIWDSSLLMAWRLEDA